MKKIMVAKALGRLLLLDKQICDIFDIASELPDGVQKARLLEIRSDLMFNQNAVMRILISSHPDLDPDKTLSEAQKAEIVAELRRHGLGK